MGGAGHAGPLLNDSIIMNPSFTSFMPTYSFSFNYLPFSGPLYATPAGPVEPIGHSYNVSILDGRSPVFQAGLSYTQHEGQRIIHVGASKRAVERLGFGLGGKYYLDGPGVGTGMDGTLAVTVIPIELINSTLIVDNVFETKATEERGGVREFILGTKFNIKKIVLLYLDPHYVPSLDRDEWGYEAGVEFPMMSDLFLRIGAFRNSLIPHQKVRGRGYGVGAGWMSPRLSFDYGFQRALEPFRTNAHSIGTTLYF